MKSTPRVLAAAGALGLALVGFGASAAHAAPPAGQWDAPTNNFEYQAASTDLRGHFTPNGSGGTITDISVSVKTPDNKTVSTDFSNPDPSGSFEWVPPAWAYNGAYTATATGQNTIPGGLFSQPQVDTNQISVNFFVNALPQTPTGVTATVDDAARTVTVKWNKNPEPDLQFYVLNRFIGNSSAGSAFFAPVSDNPSYVDKLGSAPAGTYHYDVYPVRQPAQPKTEKPLTSKVPATASTTVHSSPPATTTTTSPGGGTTGTTATPGGSGSSSSGPVAAQRGKVDLSAFGALLDSKTQLPASSTPSASGGGVPDPGFNQSLPYGSQAKPNGGTGNSAALGAPDTRLATSKERPTSLLFMAAGLLATVLLMHVLWVKSEVDRVALDPLPARAREEPRLP